MRDRIVGRLVRYEAQLSESGTDDSSPLRSILEEEVCRLKTDLAQHDSKQRARAAVVGSHSGWDAVS
jgi:hypothetical protein